MKGKNENYIESCSATAGNSTENSLPREGNVSNTMGEQRQGDIVSCLAQGAIP